VDVYNAAPAMQAVGMVSQPEIGQIARELQMLQMSTPRYGKGKSLFKSRLLQCILSVWVLAQSSQYR